MKIHAGIVQQVRLGDADAGTGSGLDCNRQECHPSRIPLGESRVCVDIFKRVEELILKRTSVPDIGNPGRGVVGEIEFCGFARYLNPFPGYKTVCHAVVACAEDYVKIFCHQCQLIILVVNCAAFKVLCNIIACVTALYAFAEIDLASIYGTVGERQGNLGRGNQLHAVFGYAPRELRRSPDVQRYVSVRRNNVVIFCLNSYCSDNCRESNQNSFHIIVRLFLT